MITGPQARFLFVVRALPGAGLAPSVLQRGIVANVRQRAGSQLNRRSLMRREGLVQRGDCATSMHR
jgi:hypothetical protein